MEAHASAGIGRDFDSSCAPARQCEPNAPHAHLHSGRTPRGPGTPCSSLRSLAARRGPRTSELEQSCRSVGMPRRYYDIHPSPKRRLEPLLRSRRPRGSAAENGSAPLVARASRLRGVHRRAVAQVRRRGSSSRHALLPAYRRGVRLCSRHVAFSLQEGWGIRGVEHHDGAYRSSQAHRVEHGCGQGLHV
jgi:hypothetical protein